MVDKKKSDSGLIFEIFHLILPLSDRNHSVLNGQVRLNERIIFEGEMRKIIIALLPVTFLLVLNSCGNSGSKIAVDDMTPSEKILQQEDGTLSLTIEKASFYKNEVDPSCNTAEWNIVVSKPGRYSVWLSSATKDTMNLCYTNSVKINLDDERLEAKPIGDRIVLNANEVKYPYYRADSYMGSFYIQEAGEYNLQVISEKVGNTADIKAVVNPSEVDTKLMSVILTPMTR
jgi:hypothetical protein